ncbi:MAG TPA: maltose ABC transporter substrate-binding protein [Stackebrandtia sp.]|jgi:arabinogalactan oligomer/maltooligosaccharide transport system substrate-binding protein|uniref:sugar ABC transporter substrate-binding protein n=1 Tax=Stackebrandtia sp. TaxID=2023065 RepID=UPI002D4ED709|nr:maltose ABC transporter substrate-binding protein [Stackebrandtia sp.]HZE37922.1 maltose ABC transporter substrate-binding protein [Stackebrandtia sp.]
MRSTRAVIAAAAALSLTLTGCSAAAGGDKSGKTGLVIWADDVRGKVLKPFAEEFGKANGIKVKVETHSPDDLQKDFIDASQQNEGPDVLVAAHDWIGNLVQNGTIDPVQLSQKQKDALDPVTLKAVTYDGKIYGTPYARENLALIRNTKLAPKAPKTIEDLTSTGRKLVAKHKAKDVLSVQVGDKGDPYHMYPFFASGGGYLFGTNKSGEYDPSDLGLSKPGAVAAFKKIAKLGADKVMKTSINADNAIPLFTEGKTPYLISGQWALPKVKKAGFDYEVSAIPGFSGGKAATPFVGVQAFYAASKGKHKTMASEFVTNYASTDKLSKALYKADPRIPASTSVYQSVSKSDPDVAAFLAAAKGGDILPSIPEMSAVWDPFGKAEAAVLDGKDPTKSIKDAAKSISDAIKKNK